MGAVKIKARTAAVKLFCELPIITAIEKPFRVARLELQIEL